MKFLTAEEAKTWCHARGLRVTTDQYLQYQSDNPHCFSVGLEEKPSRVIALADYLVPTWEERPFDGALLWIRERGVWGDHSEKIATMIVDQMRFANGQRESLEDRPVQLFASEEMIEMHSYFVIPLLFGWDAFLIPEGREYFVFVSHDGVAEVVSRTAETAEELRERLRNWNPQENTNWYSRIAGGAPRI
jgi:hypothetical protein